METPPRFIAIQSFPKSGNTWMRHILGALCSDERRDLDGCIPDLHVRPLPRRPVRIGNGTYFIYKTHSAVEVVRNRNRVIRNDLILHLRRHPLDVFLSYMNHVSDRNRGTAPVRFPSLEEIRNTPLFDAYFSSFVLHGTIMPQFRLAGSWFAMNAAWRDRAAGRHDGATVLCLRYEDMLSDPVTALAPLSDWLCLGAEEITRALAVADAQTRPDGHFFWQRGRRAFGEYLSAAQIAFFLHHRGAEAAALGYGPETFVPPSTAHHT